jgi:hypothetical protein
MRKFLLIAALAAPFLVSTAAKADDDAAKPAKTKKSKKMKHTKTEKSDGSSTETKTTVEKTEKPADAPPNP